jgi:hypothetical protein
MDKLTHIQFMCLNWSDSLYLKSGKGNSRITAEVIVAGMLNIKDPSNSSVRVRIEKILDQGKENNYREGQVVVAIEDELYT